MRKRSISFRPDLHRLEGRVALSGVVPALPHKHVITTSIRSAAAGAHGGTRAAFQNRPLSYLAEIDRGSAASIVGSTVPTNVQAVPHTDSMILDVNRGSAAGVTGTTGAGGIGAIVFAGGGGFGGFGNDFDIRQVDRFEATAEIVMRRGPIPQGELRAFNARQVVATVGPTVVLPGQERSRR